MRCAWLAPGPKGTPSHPKRFGEFCNFFSYSPLICYGLQVVAAIKNLNFRWPNPWNLSVMWRLNLVFFVKLFHTAGSIVQTLNMILIRLQILMVGCQQEERYQLRLLQSMWRVSKYTVVELGMKNPFLFAFKKQRRWKQNKLTIIPWHNLQLDYPLVDYPTISEENESTKTLNLLIVMYSWFRPLLVLWLFFFCFFAIR